MDTLIFALLYQLLSFPIFLLVLDRGLKAALAASGYSYLTAENLAEFLLEPWTAVFLILLVLFGVLLMSVEAGAFLTAYQGTAYFRRVTPLGMGLGGLEKTADEGKKRNGKVFLVIAAGGLFLNFVPLSLLLSRIKPVNFVLEELWALPWGPALLGAAVLLLFLWLWPRAFVLCYCMVEQKSYEDSLWHSRQMMKRRGLWITAMFLGLNLFLGLAMSGIYALGNLLVFLAAEIVVEPSLRLAARSLAMREVELALLFLYSILTSVVNLGFFAGVYYQEEKKEHRLFAPKKARKGWEDKGKIRILLAGLFCLSFFLLFQLGVNGSRLRDDALMEIQITAHRGSSRSAPENTMAAIEAAVEEMADFAEVDVQETLDGVLVLCHDRTLKRIAGLNRKITEMTFQQLQEIDAGSFFSDAFSGERIPALETVMEYAKGRINLNLELKNIGSSTSLPEKTAAMIQEWEMEEQCVVSSTSLDYLKRVKAADPDIRTGYIVAAAYGSYYLEDCLDFISVRSSFVSRAMVERVHEAGKAVHVWTVNSAAEMEEMKAAGVDNLITDYPVMAREICFSPEEEGILFFSGD